MDVAMFQADPFAKERLVVHTEGLVGLVYLEPEYEPGMFPDCYRHEWEQLLACMLEKLEGQREIIEVRCLMGEDLLVLTATDTRDRELARRQTEMMRRKLVGLAEDIILSQGFAFGRDDRFLLLSGCSLLRPEERQLAPRSFYAGMKEAIRRTRSRKTEQQPVLLREFLDILRKRAITSVYQPIIHIPEFKVYGYEALTRGPAESVFHSPLKLFAFAERAGSLYSLDKLARETAIRNCRGLQQNQKLFVNIPSNIMHDPDFTPGQTKKVLETCNLEPTNVVFEITERSSIEDFSSVKKVLCHYRNQGYQIAIDDAGAGYSSLQAIAELQPDFVKVDRSLTQGVASDKMKATILETFIAFAQKMDIKLIAEGIEQRADLEKLGNLGVEYVQGYYVGRPQPLPEAFMTKVGATGKTG